MLLCLGSVDDNVRLGAGSPVIDVGDNGYIPADLTDDGDGDTNETAPFGLGGQLRRRGPAVDLGAYERNTAPPTTSYLPLILRESTRTCLVHERSFRGAHCVDTPRKARYSTVGLEQRTKNREQNEQSVDVFSVLCSQVRTVCYG
jgi:hypothetical protein